MDDLLGKNRAKKPPSRLWDELFDEGKTAAPPKKP